MNSPGFTRPSLNCKLEECQKDFLLFQARSDVEEVEELPDPFPAKMYALCGKQLTQKPGSGCSSR